MYPGSIAVLILSPYWFYCDSVQRRLHFNKIKTVSSLLLHGLGRTFLTHHRPRYIPLHLPLKLGYRIEGLGTLPTTGTECIANRQTDRWVSVICFSFALRRPSAAFATSPTAKLPPIAFYYSVGEISPKSTLTLSLHPLRPLSCQPLVDFPLDIETCHETLGDVSYYRDRMHCEQTDTLPDICRYLISPTPTPSPSYIFRKLVISRMSSITFEFSDCLPIIFVLGVKTRILLDSKIQKNPKEFNGSASLLASAFFVHLYERCEKFLIRRIRRKLTGYSFHI